MIEGQKVKISKYALNHGDDRFHGQRGVVERIDSPRFVRVRMASGELIGFKVAELRLVRKGN